MYNIYCKTNRLFNANIDGQENNNSRLVAKVLNG